MVAIGVTVDIGKVTTNVRESVLPSHLFARVALSCKNQAQRQPHAFSFYLHTFARPVWHVHFWTKADIAAQLRVYEFAPCCRSVQHDVVKYHFLIAYLA